MYFKSIILWKGVFISGQQINFENTNYNYLFSVFTTTTQHDDDLDIVDRNNMIKIPRNTSH